MEGSEILTKSFNEWLEGKKLDPKAFEMSDPITYKAWFRAFIEMHPDSFLMRYKFFINAKRRRFPLPSNSE